MISLSSLSKLVKHYDSQERVKALKEQCWDFSLYSTSGTTNIISVSYLLVHFGMTRFYNNDLKISHFAYCKLARMSQLLLIAYES
jgi:hypothetical protein